MDLSLPLLSFPKPCTIFSPSLPSEKDGEALRLSTVISFSACWVCRADKDSLEGRVLGLSLNRYD